MSDDQKDKLPKISGMTLGEYMSYVIKNSTDKDLMEAEESEGRSENRQEATYIHPEAERHQT